MKLLLLFALAAALTSCTTVTSPDGTVTKSVDPALSASLSNGAVIISGAAAHRIAAEISTK